MPTTAHFLASSPQENGELVLRLAFLRTSFPNLRLSSCRLQGFPESFALPFTNANSQRNLVAQFYRQIGNAVSPPCVAAVAESAVSSFLLREGQGVASGAVFDIILNASQHKAKVLDAIAAKSFDVSLG